MDPFIVEYPLEPDFNMQDAIEIETSNPLPCTLEELAKNVNSSSEFGEQLPQCNDAGQTNRITYCWAS